MLILILPIFLTRLYYTCLYPCTSTSLYNILVYTQFHRCTAVHSIFFTYQYLRPGTLIEKNHSCRHADVAFCDFFCQCWSSEVWIHCIEVPPIRLGVCNSFCDDVRSQKNPNDLAKVSFQDTLSTADLSWADPKWMLLWVWTSHSPHSPISGKVCTSNDWGLSGWNHWRGVLWAMQDLNRWYLVADWNTHRFFPCFEDILWFFLWAGSNFYPVHSCTILQPPAVTKDWVTPNTQYDWRSNCN